MRIRHVLLFAFLIFSTLVLARRGILDRVITVEIKSTPIKGILRVIEERGSVQFSYNPNLIEENKIVSLSIKNKTIGFGLSLIFDGDVRFKEVGNHIILLRNEDAVEIKKRRKSNLVTVFRGQIRDKRSGAVLEGVSVYDVDARYAGISDEQGNYELEIPNAETVRSIYVRKRGYKEFVFVVDASIDSVIVQDVQLEPIPDHVQKLNPKRAEKIYLPVEERALSGALVSYDTYVHTENLEEIKESRIMQLSLVPSVSIGSNLSTNGLITNNLSFNILAGYSSGVDGVEFGGILNMVKGDVRWAQAAGICNLVGGDVMGGQSAGIVNLVRGSFVGAQSGGISNVVGENFTGGQLAGISNLVHGDFLGVQYSGIASYTKGRFTGVQGGGIISVIRGGMVGVQMAGISNTLIGEAGGLQLAGIHNTVYGSLIGGQLAGISNFSKSGTNFIQIAGIANHSEKNQGLQLSGIINHANQNNGLQIALANINKGGNGISLGLINFVKNGYHKTEIAANETFLANVTIKSGVKHFYNTYNLSYQPGEAPLYAFGLGLGGSFSMTQKWWMNLDLFGQSVFENLSIDRFSQVYKFSATADYRLKRIAFFAGPTFNVNVLHINDGEGNYAVDLANNPLFSTDNGNIKTTGWIGGQIGIRL